MKTTGNTVLITGGASGIGLALAREFIARGNVVLICGRDAARLERARSELPGPHTFACDIAEPAGRDALLACVRQRFPSINVLVNNAAVAARLDFTADAIDERAVEREIATNLLAPVHLAARFLPMLRGQDGATIINVSAVLAYAPIAALPVHSATKSALRSFTQSLRRQLDGAVRVIEVVPPVVDTPMQRDLAVPKMDAGAFARRVLARIERGDLDVHVGQATLFRIMSRLAPRALFRMLNAAVDRSGARAATPGREVAHARA